VSVDGVAVSVTTALPLQAASAAAMRSPAGMDNRRNQPAQVDTVMTKTDLSRSEAWSGHSTRMSTVVWVKICEVIPSLECSSRVRRVLATAARGTPAAPSVLQANAN
jgi:hypothetical protein